MSRQAYPSSPLWRQYPAPKRHLRAENATTIQNSKYASSAHSITCDASRKGNVDLISRQRKANGKTNKRFTQKSLPPRHLWWRHREFLEIGSSVSPSYKKPAYPEGDCASPSPDRRTHDTGCPGRIQR